MKHLDAANRCGRAHSHRPQGGGQAGSTLTEVLVSLLIMSIGLVSLATMFPISALRSVRALQLTTSTDLRYNVENIIEMYRGSLQGFSNDFSRFVVDPDFNGVSRDENDNSGANYTRYVIDPIGWNEVRSARMQAGNAVAIENSFGNVDGQPWLMADGSLQMPRYAYGRTTMASAEALAMMPDSYGALYDGLASSSASQPGAGGITELTLPGLARSSVVWPGTQRLRAVIFAAEGNRSQVRWLTDANLASETVRWTEDINGNGNLDAGEDLNGSGAIEHFPVSGNFTPGRVRIEAQERRYTWLATVRRTGGSAAEVDIVVFFRRGFGAMGVTQSFDNDERLYDVDFVAGSSLVAVRYPPNDPAQKPFMRKGGYVFDAANAFWYRIQNVQADDRAGRATLTLESPAFLSSPNNALRRKAMFPKSVVDVFPIGAKS
jgi:hypothetical protein